MPLSSVSSSFSAISKVPDFDNAGVQKNKLIDKIKMVYGFHEDIFNFKKIDNSAISLDILNLISAMDFNTMSDSPGVFFHNLLSKKFRTNDSLLKKYSDKLSIKENDLRRISEKWIKFLSEHGNELSLSSSLNKRTKKTENALSDFILKNFKLNQEVSDYSQLVLKKINSDPAVYNTMKSIYKAFLKSDEQGFRKLKSFKQTRNIAYHLFEQSIITAIIRKISKLGLDFSFSPDSGISSLNFIKPGSIKDLLINVSNQDKWRGNKNFSGIGNVYEPITFSELRYVRKHNLAVSYTGVKDK